MLRVSIVQQAAWDVPIDSMPLAAGYMKAVLDSDASLAAEVRTDIRSFRGGVTLYEMARDLLNAAVPDILAFSVLGWNYRKFGCLAETYKQLKPDGLVVFGGVHVAYQAERVFREYPWVDVVVNGEGELTFRELVMYRLAHPNELDPDSVQGISYRREDGGIHTTADRERIEDLDIIPSPFLTGAIPLTDAAGNFRYDVALMETNRGCPYKCSFCYWGGAVGQRVRSFSRERLAAEIELFGRLRAPAVCLCDANFGLLEADEEFVEDLIRVRQKYGFPRALETSWAKNKSERFRRIVKTMKEHGFHSSFVLSLQTLADEPLNEMQRRNMKVNQWESLVSWLREEGLDCIGELIWGAPGETPQSFLDGYDRLSEKINRIAVYPLLLLPNTAYVRDRQQHGFVTIRGEDDDFEYVLASRSADLRESMHTQRFVFWARLLGEHHYMYVIWAPTREATGLTQSQIIMSLMNYADRSADPAVISFRESIPVLAESPAVIRALRRLFAEPELTDAVRAWWESEIVPRYPSQWQAFARELYQFECWSRPLYVPPGSPVPIGWHVVGESPDDQQYVSDPIWFTYDIPAVLAGGVDFQETPPVRGGNYVFRSSVGFYYNADNHEVARNYRSRAELVGGTATDSIPHRRDRIPSPGRAVSPAGRGDRTG